MSNYTAGSKIVWVNCQMTGLDVNTNQLLEIAVVITDANLNEIDSLGPLIIKTEEYVLRYMDEWNLKHHRETGLYQACLQSNLTIDEADQQLHDLMVKRGLRSIVLGGNNIDHNKLFLKKYCPLFAEHFYFRSIDVSSLAEITRRWYPHKPFFKKHPRHRAWDDIKESIAEMKFYRNNFFK